MRQVRIGGEPHPRPKQGYVYEWFICNVRLFGLPFILQTDHVSLWINWQHHLNGHRYPDISVWRRVAGISDQ